MTLEEAAAVMTQQQAVIEEQHALIAQLQEQVAQLEQKVAELEALKTPPPPWARANRPRRDKLAEQERKKRAPEHNHGRRTMTPTRIVPHAYERCPDCDYHLCGASIARRREVIDLPVAAVEVTEHQVIKRYCPVCQAWKMPRLDLAGEVVGHGRIGVRLMSLIGVLRMVHRLPLALVQDLLAQVYGLALSEGGICQVLERLRAALGPTCATIVAQSRASPSRHLDETGWRENGQNGYLWVEATDEPRPTRVFTYHPSRAGAVADALVGAYDGVLVTDGYAAYDHLPCAKQRCWTHILRTAREIREKHPQDALLADWTHALKALYHNALSVAQDDQLSLRQRAAAASDAERRMRTLAGCYRHTPDHAAQALATWLHRHLDELFTFVRVPGVAGTNNLAERTVRPQVTARKISGGTRSPQGSAVRCDLATVFSTFKARGLNPFTACIQALQTLIPQV
ncbi:MAG: IS66 family transposase [Thermomicrobiales bacterium]